MRYIVDFKEEDHIVGHYLCKLKQSMKSKSGKNYLSLRLQDKTGSIDAKVWELNNQIQSFEDGDFIKVDGLVVSYQNELQLKVNKIRKSEVGEYIEADYIPTTEKDVKMLYEELLGYIDGLSTPCIKTLLKKIFVEHPLISKEFLNHSAAKSMHHSFMGGLIEHTVSVVEICDFMSGRYKFVNRDLLLSTAMLHDIGKIYEISNFPENDYTDDGQMLGHIMIGIDLIGDTARDIENFPPKLLSLMKHSILAHHGEYEYGSPKKPKTIEAFILHCADDMDAKVKIFEEVLEKDNTQGNWVGYHRMLERNIRKSNY